MSLLQPMERHGPRVLTPPAPSAGSSAPILHPCKVSSSPLGLSLHDTPGPAPALDALTRPCGTAFVSVGTTDSIPPGLKSLQNSNKYKK